MFFFAMKLKKTSPGSSRVFVTVNHFAANHRHDTPSFCFHLALGSSAFRSDPGVWEALCAWTWYFRHGELRRHQCGTLLGFYSSDSPLPLSGAGVSCEPEPELSGVAAAGLFCLSSLLTSFSLSVPPRRTIAAIEHRSANGVTIEQICNCHGSDVVPAQENGLGSGCWVRLKSVEDDQDDEVSVWEKEDDHGDVFRDDDGSQIVTNVFQWNKYFTIC